METHLVAHTSSLQSELRGGFESTILGFSTAISPMLFFLGTFGSHSLAAAFWATLVTAMAAPAVRLLLRGEAALLPSARSASLAAYVALVVLLGTSMGALAAGGIGLSARQLVLGLAAGSLMFALASGLILVSGLLRLGNVFKMIPSTVTSGISNSTALLLVWLAVQQVTHSTWAAALSAGVMVICVVLWTKVQAHVRALAHVPGVLVALLAGLAVSLVTEPAVAPPAAGPALSLAWISVRLWPSLLAQPDLARMLFLAVPASVTLALVMVLESFTATAVMETRFGLRIDASRELVVLGGSNLVSALLGGVPCTGAPTRCVAGWTAGGRGVGAAVASLVLTGLLLLALGSWLLALPAGVAAGLFLLQVPLMVDPAFRNRLLEMVKTRRWKGQGAVDLGFWITLVITLVGFFGSLIWACFMGIGLSCLVVLRRVSSTLTARWAYLDQYRSRRVRSPGESGNLMRVCHRVGVLRLTGHLFFGNSTRLTQLVDELHPEATAVVIDVSQVHDVDPSGLGALVWAVRALLDRQLTVVLAGLQQTPSAELRQTLRTLPGVVYSIDLDRGLEVCEERVLQNSTVITLPLLSVPIDENHLLTGLSDEEVAAVLRQGQRREVDQGDALFLKGAVADSIWLLEQGTVSILSGGRDNALSTRLATLGPGQFLGEMGYIDGKSRSATARADTPVRAMLLDTRAIDALLALQPAAALKITRNIARELSNRVRISSDVIKEAPAFVRVNNALGGVSP